ncbi:unnamed protein product [Candidula unifasciata]|uniref:Uncharacterized protein n=1 Tax=Candidula unifasciata TaxID=100452 RepID=A0A8S3YQH4_9EUPU|nr:unnamed protein product [Candidula unifasciata]
MEARETSASETNSLKKLYEEFGGSTSMHGINKVLTASSKRKRCVWSVLFLFGVAFAVYQFVITMEDFYSYPVMTVVTLKQETTAIFPAVTFCNLNQKKKSMIDPYLMMTMTEMAKVIVLSVCLSVSLVIYLHYSFYFLFQLTDEAEGEAVMKTLMRSHQHGNQSGHQIQDMLIKCTFNKVSTVLLCYVTRSGPRNGLILELNIEQYEYLPTTSLAGLNVIVHPQDEIPLPEDGGILAQPGAMTRIGIKQEITQRLPSPYSNCVSADGQSRTRRSFYQKKTYTQNACMKSCYQMAVYEKCECCNAVLPCDYYDILNVDRTTTKTNENLSLCETFSDFKCETEVENLFLKHELDCDEHCPPACDRTTFDMIFSTAQWPPDSKIDTFLDTIKSNFLQNVSFADNYSLERFIHSNFLRIEIFLESLEFKEFTTQAKYDWNLLLGTIGGLLGLGLGFSLLTAMEIVEVLIETVLYCAHRKYQKKKNIRI